jgi:two-component system chemotaxis response regulator CheB
MKKKLKVLIVDSSITFRETLSKVLGADPMIEVIGIVSDPFIAAARMALQVPDVITTDIDMPRMDGLTFLKKIMSQHPIPVVIISNSIQNKQIAAKGLEYGATEVITKEGLESKEITIETKIRICNVVKEAASRQLKPKPVVQPVIQPKLSADVILKYVKPKVSVLTNEKVIVVGASTGGTDAIRIFLQALPEDSPGIVIVQHMPENFTRSFADRLNEVCSIRVKEAENGDIVKRGWVLIAPGNRHILLKKKGVLYYVELNDGSPVNRHRPSVDVLFRSTAMCAGRNSTGILLTGMGDDGAKGLLEMKDAGGNTIAQDEKTCVVFGMPREAIMLNAADKVLPLQEIARYVMQQM